jgi:hypothetical protein
MLDGGWIWFIIGSLVNLSIKVIISVDYAGENGRKGVKAICKWDAELIVIELEKLLNYGIGWNVIRVASRGMYNTGRTRGVMRRRL